MKLSRVRAMGPARGRRLGRLGRRFLAQSSGYTSLRPHVGGFVMDTWIWMLVLAAVAVAAILFTMARSMKARFGPEYDRTLDAEQSRGRAEHDLRKPQERRAVLNLLPLTPAARDRYQSRWAELQSHFVDRPQIAVADADSMITQVMRELGYPIDD